MTDRHGERRDTPLGEPAPTITSKARTARWYDSAPAPTLTAAMGNGNFHWVEDRPATTIAADPRVFQPGGHHEPGEQSANAVTVTVTEAAVLQSFPPDYPWQGSRTAKFTQIGNAVPPLMARAVIAALLGDVLLAMARGAAGNPPAEDGEARQLMEGTVTSPGA